MKNINLVFSLLTEANASLLSEEDRCKDISLFYSFIVFIISGIKKFKNLSLTIAPFLDEAKSILNNLKNK